MNHPRRPSWPIPLTVTLILLSLIGVMVGLACGFLFIFSDSCGTGPDEPVICTDRGKLTLLFAPWLSLGGALLFAAGGGELLRRAGRSPWLALPFGVLVYLTGVAASWAVFTL